MTEDFFSPFHLMFLLFAFAITMLPTIVAGVRKVKNFWWIFLINFFLGWTVVGFIVALVWAIRDTPRYVGRIPQPPYNR